MNLVKCYVTRVLSDPWPVKIELPGETVTMWKRKIEYNSYGRKSVSVWLFDTEEEAKSIKKGDWRLR